MDVLIAVATIGVPVANVSTQVLLVLASLADVLATIFSGGVVPDVTRVLPQVATILTNVSVVAPKVTGVLMDIPPVRANIVGLAVRHAWVHGRVRVVDTLCAYEVRTSNEQGCGNSSHSEFAHGFSQRQDRALAALACAACTTVAHSPTLSASFDVISGRQVFPGQSFRLRVCMFARCDRDHRVHGKRQRGRTRPRSDPRASAAVAASACIRDYAFDLRPDRDRRLLSRIQAGTASP